MKNNSIKNILKMIRTVNRKDKTTALALKSAMLGLLVGVNWLDEAIAADMTAAQVVEKLGQSMTAAEKQQLVQELDSVIKATQAGTAVSPVTQEALGNQLAELAQATGLSEAELMEILQSAGLPQGSLTALETQIAASYQQVGQVADAEVAQALGGAEGEGVLPVAAGIGLGPILGVGAGVAAVAGAGGGGGGDAVVVPPNNVPTAEGVTNGAVVEDASTPNLTSVVSANFSDADLGDVLDYSQTPAAGNTLGGTLTLLAADDSGDDADGSVSFTYTVANSATQSLAAGQTVTESFVITATDDDGATVSQTVTITITGTNDVPTIVSAVAAGDVTEIADLAMGENATLLSDSGTIVFADVDLIDTHSVSAAPAALGYLGTFTPVLDQATKTVTWTFEVQDSAVDFLAAGETRTQTYTVTVEDSAGTTVDQTVTITITGTNDVPTIVSAVAAGDVTEIADLAMGENATLLSDSGTIVFADVDLIDTHSVSAAPAALGYLGTFTPVLDQATKTVTWTFEVQDSAVDFLAAGETRTQIYTVTIEDSEGTTVDQTVTITITGTNDVPTIVSAVAAGDVTEIADLAMGENATLLSDSGDIVFADVDLIDTHSVSAAPAAMGYLGTFTPVLDQATKTVTWTFEVQDSAVDFLAAGETRTQIYTVTIEDSEGTTVDQTVTITITGTNDIPTVVAFTDGAVTEDDATPLLTSTVSVDFNDVDLLDVLEYSQAPSATNTLGGMLTLLSSNDTGTGASGSVSYTYSVSNTATQYLGEGDTATETFVITAEDDTGAIATQTVTVTITGTNDIPTIVVSDAVPFVEDVAGDMQILSQSGLITFNDVDTSDLLDITSAYNNDIVWNKANSVTPGTLDAALSDALIAGFVAEALAQSNSGSLNWNYDVPAQNLDFLAEGDSIELSFTVTVEDPEGESASGVVNIRIEGTNDAPTLQVVASNETSITLLAADPDDGASINLESSISGVSTLNNGSNTVINVAAAIVPTQISLIAEDQFNAKGSAGTVLALGSVGNDTLNASAVTEKTIIYGFGGNDTITGSAQDDTIYGGVGNDTIVGFVGAGDVVNGGDGSDTLTLDGTSDDLNNAADEQLSNVELVDASAAVAGVVLNLANQTEAIDVNGSAQDDDIAGSLGANVINAGAGDDDVAGLAGDDTINGEEGNDRLVGNNGNDSLFGGAGDDVLVGDNLTAVTGILGVPGDDYLDGGDGNDVLVGEAGEDTLLGGSGDDLLFGDSDDALIDGGADNDTLVVIDSFVQSDDAKLTNVEVITGISPDLTAVGGLPSSDAAVTIDLTGQTEDFTIITGGNDDTITSGAGNDTIMSGVGADVIDGGAGIDRVVYSNPITYTSENGAFIVDSGDGEPDTLSNIEIIEADGQAILFVGNGGFASLSDALMFANDGDTIVLADEVIVGDANIDKSVTIVGANNAGIAFDSPTRGTESTLAGQITVTAAGVIIDGVSFDIDQSGAGGGEGVLTLAGTGATVTNSIFTQDVDAGVVPFAILVTGESNLINGNLIDRSAIPGSGSLGNPGISVSGADNVTITNNELELATIGVVTGDGSELVNGLVITGNDIDGAPVSTDSIFVTGPGFGPLPDAFGPLPSAAVVIENNTFGATEAGLQLRGTNLNDDFSSYATGANDFFQGYDGNDILDGGAGDDRLVGDAGDDTIVGGAGDDTIDGGTGLDTVLYDGPVVVSSIIDPMTMISTGFSVSAGAEGTDALINVEKLIADGQTYLLVGNGGYDTIQEAVDAATGGEIIVVSSGTYTETVTIDVGVTILGANSSELAHIDGLTNTARIAESTLLGTFIVGADDVTISGFEITGAAAAIQAMGANTSFSGLTIENNYIHDTTDSPIRFGLGFGGGVDSANWDITGNWIENINGDAKTAMVLFNIDGLNIDNNFVDHSDTAFSGRRGLNLDGSSNVSVTDNIVRMGADVANLAEAAAGLAAAWAIQIGMSDQEVMNITIDGNELSGARFGVVGLSQRSLDGLTVTNNTITEVYNGVSLNSGSAAPVATNVVNSNIVLEGNIIEAITNAYRLRDLHDNTVNGPVVFETVTIDGNTVLSGIVRVGGVDGALGGDDFANIAGVNTFTGTAGDDIVMVEGTGTITVNALEGADLIRGASGADVINAGAGADTVIDFMGADSVDGGDGIDTLKLTGTSTDLNVAADGQLVSVEVIDASGAAAGVEIDLSNQVEGFEIVGSSGDDTIKGSAGNDTINGSADIAMDADTDTVMYINAVTITSGAAGFVVDAGLEGIDTLSGVEKVVTGTQTFLLVGNGGYNSIQEAIDAAVDGNTIVLADETFMGDVIVDKGVTIISANNAGKSGNDMTRMSESVIDGELTITTTSKVVIDGVTFLNNDEYTLDINDNYVAVKVLAHASEASGGHVITNSIFLRDPVTDPANYIADTFRGSALQPTHRAIELAKVSVGSAVVVSDNLFTGTNPYFYAGDNWRTGVYSNGGEGATSIADNTFENVRGALNLDDFGTSVSVTGNDFESAGSAISIGGIPADASDLTSISGNTFGRVDTDFNGQNLNASQPVVLDIGALGGPAVGEQIIEGQTVPEFFVALTGAGDDMVTGSTGNDFIVTNAGNDMISAGVGDDVVNAGAGDDTIVGGAGDDTIDGGTGLDTLDFGTETIQLSDFDFVGGEFVLNVLGQDTVVNVERVIGGGDTFLIVGSGGFATIQDAVAAAADGQTIVVTEGNYSGTVTIGSGLNDVTIIGVGNAVLDGAFNIQGTGTTLQSLRIIDGASILGQDTTVYVGAADVTLNNLDLEKVDAPQSAGGTFRGVITEINDAANLMIDGVNATGFATGIYFNPGASNSTVINSELVNNFVGMSIDGSDGVTLTDNVFNGNLEDLGLGPVFQSLTATGNDFVNGVIGNFTGVVVSFGPNEFAGVEYNSLQIGSANDDMLMQTAGNDYIDGGAGTDNVTYLEEILSIESMNGQTVVTTATGVDLLVGIESINDNGVNTLLVGNGGYATIQEAVDAADPGDTILVAAGTYNENVVIDKSDITLLSIDGAETTIIDGISGIGQLGTIQLASGTANVTVGAIDQGFTVLGLNGNGAIENAAVYMVGASHTGHVFQGNTITARGDAGLQSDFGGAVVGVTIDSNIFNGQTFVGAEPDQVVGFGTQFNVGNNVPRQLVTLGNGGGAGASASSDITFSNNVVSGTTGGGTIGNTLVTIDASDSTVSDNTFDGFTEAGGFALRMRRDGAEVTNNTLDHSEGGNSAGFFFQNQTGPAADFAGNELIGGENNEMVVLTPGDDQVNGGEPAMGSDLDTMFVGNAVDIEIGDGFFTVTGAGSGVDTLVNMEKVVATNGNFFLVGNGGFDSIQEAINAAANGDTILVAAGTYNENLTISKGVTILGMNAGVAGDGVRGDEAVIDGTIVVNSATAVTIDGVKVLNNEAVGAGRAEVKSLTFTTSADHVITNTVFESAVFGGSNAIGGIRDTAIFTNVMNGGSITITNNLITSTDVNGENGLAFGAFGTAAWGRGIWINGGTVDVSIDSNALFSTRSGINLEEYNDDLRSVTNNDFTLAGSGVSLGSPIANDPIEVTAITGNNFDAVGTTFNFGNLNENVTFDATATMNTAVNSPLVIVTGSGSDVVSGSTGNDVVNGGAGIDTVEFVGSVTVAAGTTAGTFAVTSMDDGSDAVFNVEKLSAANGEFLLVGNGGFATIQDAVAVAASGQTIVVAAGNYAGTITIGAALTNLTIVGLSGAVLNGAFNIAGDGTTIDGLAIQNGALVSGSKTAIYLNASDVTLSNLVMTNPTPFDMNTFGIESVFGADTSGLTITNVNSTGFQTGLYLNPGAEGTVVSDSSFIGTRAGAGVDSVQDLTLTNSTFDGNDLDLELFNIDGTQFVANDNTFVDGAIQNNQYGGQMSGVLSFGPSTFGGTDYDSLQIGSANSDVVTSGAGQDYLFGGAGEDSLSGGTGSDTFAFTAAGQTATIVATDNGDGVLSNGDTFAGNFDVITDFVSLDNDMIDLSAINSLAAGGDVFAGLAADEFQFIRGDFAANVFTANDAGADTLLAFDDGTNDVGVILLGVESLNENDDFIS